jgi:hypothetical protein
VVTRAGPFPVPPQAPQQLSNEGESFQWRPLLSSNLKIAIRSSLIRIRTVFGSPDPNSSSAVPEYLVIDLNAKQVHCFIALYLKHRKFRLTKAGRV